MTLKEYREAMLQLREAASKQFSKRKLAVQDAASEFAASVWYRGAVVRRCSNGHVQGMALLDTPDDFDKTLACSLCGIRSFTVGREEVEKCQ